MSVLHANMKINRRQLRLTQQDVAEMLNVDRSTYTAYETKRVPSLDVLIKLSKLYCLTLDELVGVVRYDDPIKLKEPNSLFGVENDTLDIFDKYLSPSERKLLFSIRMLNDEHIKEVVSLVEKCLKEDCIPDEK